MLFRSIDKEGVGRVVAEGCNETNGHSLWGINLGVGNYSAHITVYNDEKWIDTNTVYFSVVPPSYSNLEINKQKVGNAEDVKFKINTNHAEFMVLKIENEKGEEVYVERCSDSLDSWSVKADKLAVGHYERFIDESLNKNSNVTTGKVYWSVLQKERRGDFGGGTVQVIPHITNEIKSRFFRDFSTKDTKIAIIEVGGTVGDIESQPFLEAIRQFQHEVGREKDRKSVV